MEPKEIFEILAVFLTVVYSVPQVVKVYLSNSPKAVSGITTVLMVFSSLSMLLFGFFSANIAVQSAYLFLFLSNLVVLLLIVQKAGVNKLRISITSIVFAAGLACCALFLPKDTFGYFGGIVSSFMVIPQGFKMIRQREATGVSGLSYLLMAFASLSWLAYGHLTENMLLVLPNLVVFPTAALVYINVLKYRSANYFYQSVKTTR
ncbi:SemiSWEET family transporter [Oscillatoria amoena NRMC-F 0135]|nr:SemiSWEET family transporter [Oscillatoria amoena NRMC-F 0135]